MHNHFFKYCFFWLLLFLGGLNVQAQEIIEINDDNQDFSMSAEQVLIFEDESGILKFDQIKNKPFYPAESTYPMNSNLKSSYWVKYRIKGNPKTARNWIMEVFDLHIDTLEFYQPQENGGFKKFIAGEVFPFKERTYKHINFVFDLQADYSGTRDYYVKVHSRKPAGLIFQIRSTNYFSFYAVNEYYLLGIFYGILIIMALYNLLLYFSIREPVYLFYVAYVLCIGFNLLLEDGTGFAYYWPDHPGFTDAAQFIARLLLVASFTLYSKQFLHVSTSLPQVNKFLNIAIGLYAVYYISSKIFHFQFLNDLFYIGFYIAIYLIGLYVWLRKNYKPARYFLLGYTAVFFSVVIVWLRDRGVIQTNPDNDFAILLVYALNIGTVFEIVILSLALGDQIRFMKVEREKAQERVILQLQENERLKDKVNRELEEKVVERTKELNEKNKNIIDSINYAQRIQHAILPKEDVLAEVLKDYLLVYKPKDIVSGDFYWARQKGDLLFVSAVDCTGHGVPGAIMSIMAHNLLNYAVDEMDLTDPGKILEAMDQKLHERIQLDPDSFDDQFGMDLSLCVLNKNNNILSYAGAFNSVYIINSGEIMEITANRYPVGHYFFEPDNKVFDSQSVQLQPESRVFLFSDGFADQFGGPLNEKFMTPNFKELLSTTSSMTLKDQTLEINEAFEKWKGDNHQLDDVLVIGFDARS